MLAFGLDAVAAVARSGGSEQFAPAIDGPKISGAIVSSSSEGVAIHHATGSECELSARVATAALEGQGSEQADVLRLLIADDAKHNRHPRAHVCGAALRRGVWFASTQHPPRAELLRVDTELFVVVLTPHFDFDARTLRHALPTQIHTRKHSRQAALAVGIVRALEHGRFDEVGEIYDDAVIGQAVGPQLPGYHPTVAAARRAGALMAGLSGQGPAIAAICASEAIAEDAANEMTTSMDVHMLTSTVLLSRVSPHSELV
ncbi:MAG: homoserine kinase [Bradymonadia bacterium]|jgi:homoserine kinase